MEKLRINEAIAACESKGKKVLKKDLAAKMWPKSTLEAQKVNMANLCRGFTKKISPEWVKIICKETGCTSDFLFGL